MKLQLYLENETDVTFDFSTDKLLKNQLKFDIVIK